MLHAFTPAPSERIQHKSDFHLLQLENNANFRSVGCELEKRFVSF